MRLFADGNVVRHCKTGYYTFSAPFKFGQKIDTFWSTSLPLGRSATISVRHLPILHGCLSLSGGLWQTKQTSQIFWFTAKSFDGRAPKLLTLRHNKEHHVQSLSAVW